MICRAVFLELIRVLAIVVLALVVVVVEMTEDFSSHTIKYNYLHHLRLYYPILCCIALRMLH
jgi:hypothetical protein